MQVLIFSYTLWIKQINLKPTRIQSIPVSIFFLKVQIQLMNHTVMQETHQMASRSPQSIFCQEGISRRLVTVLRMVAVQCATWRERIGEHRRHCSPVASRTFHIPALLLHLHHPCIPTGSFKGTPQTEGVQIPWNIQGPSRFNQMRIWPWIQTNLVWQSHERTQMKDVSGRGKTAWTNTGSFLTFQNWSAQLPEPQTASL